MAYIFTDTQIHGYSMILRKTALLFLLFCALASKVPAQEYSKKAIKLVEKADELIQERQFIPAVEMLKKAISTDKSYPLPYFKLTTIYNLYQRKDSAVSYYNRGIEVTPLDKVTDKMWAASAKMNYETANYEAGLEAINQLSEPDSLLKLSLEFAVKSSSEAIDLDKEELPKEINAFSMQYFPVLTVDENKIIYTKRDNNGPASDEDIFISTRINEQWIPSQPISSAINTTFNEGACSISADGRMLIFTACEGRKSFGSCDLYVSYRNGNNWSVPENLGDSINSKYWDSQPALSADGRTLYFSSNRPGGFGKRDLWVSTRTEKGWSSPINLGSTINTSRDETTPFIHVNGKALFFSSNGHYGLGGLDLFVSEKEDDWSTPQNLGVPINSKNDEISLFINANGTHGYYAMENESGTRSSKSRIVKFKIPYDSLLKNKASYVTGRVIDKDTGKPLGASFKMRNLSDFKDVYEVDSDPVSGKYFLVLTEGNQYGVFIQKENYMFEDLSFVAEENSVLNPDTIDILLSPIRPGETVSLHNIYFQIDSYELENKSHLELNELIAFIKSNPKLKFLIEGHTDNTGTELYNLDLSDKRARAVYNYLITYGVDESQISYKGFGSAKPIESNDSEAGRSKNRRINVTIVHINRD
ncbi:MAG: hypothetical protein CMB80_04535 [Flammeovirgaceae bacterium]|nr:hypothetical protein [Flammeovirgaceae bacterium]MBE61871.1 hypothetical protein [Flammeovirgaceae bacterium]HCX21396.1 hypothetical protein [Cytophagales bacterium]